MLSQSVREVFAEQDKKLAEQRREFDARRKDTLNYHAMKLQELRNEAEEHRKELVAARRWTVGTIITVGLSLAAYLSALIHFNH